MSRVFMYGLGIDSLTQGQAVERIFQSIELGRGGVVLTPNLDHLRRYTREPVVRPAYAGASLVLADGAPLVWASRISGNPLPERVAGSDLIWSVAARAARARRSVFLLGGAPGVAPIAAEQLGERCPGLPIAGLHCPPYGFRERPAELEALREAVCEVEPDIVFLGLPSPSAERVIEELRPLLREAWFLGLGVSFSFVSGHVRRAPSWMQGVGLEWAFRLTQEPGRLARRYLLDGLPFAARLLLDAARSRDGHVGLAAS